MAVALDPANPVNDVADPGAFLRESVPFGARELIAAVAGAQHVLDAGCGSGRLTVALARAGAEVTGFDTDEYRLTQAERRAAEAGVELELVRADFNEPLPFDEASFDAVTNRLALMAASDPVSTLRELRRVLAPGGRLATVLWATLPENPWFALPREAIATVLGQERASFARAFGKLGDPAEAAAVHRAAGLSDVQASLLREQATPADAEAHWEQLARENNHFARVAAELSSAQRAALLVEIAARFSPYTRDGLCLPRTLVLVTAR